jgi:hypothetical protein
MENGVEFVAGPSLHFLCFHSVVSLLTAAWVGLAKIGVVTAWINSNLRMESLAQSAESFAFLFSNFVFLLVSCLRVSECKGVICSENLWPSQSKNS